MNANSIKPIDHPEYYSFSGGYVFSIPNGKAVDEQSIVGMQLVYSGTILGKNLDQIYEANNIGVQPISGLKDNKADTFKKYVTDTFVPEAKKKLSDDTQAVFSKNNGWDVASVTVKKDGKPFKFIYLKNGKHPVGVFSKEETPDFKKIEQSIMDVEKTDLGKEAAGLKKSIQTTTQLIRDKNSQELYKQAAPDLRTDHTEDQIAKLLAVEEVYSQGSVVVNGGSYSGGEFGAVIYFLPLNKDFKPASGAMYFTKVDGQWKLKGMQLPNPATNKRP